MWKCKDCGKSNSDTAQFCVGCGRERSAAPRPRPAARKRAEEPEREYAGSKLRAFLLAFVSLLLVGAIVAVIVIYPRLRESAEEKREDRESSERDRSSRRKSDEPGTEKPEDVSGRRGEASEAETGESGGTASYVIGGDPNATPAPFVTAAPQPDVSPTPAPTPTPAVVTGDYILPESNSRYLTEDDLKGLSWEQCCLARNEIFARRGRLFKNEQIAAYFAGKSWYKGTVSPENFSESVFNSYESANVSFIHDYEIAHWGKSYY
ncbi:MAG: YARHG domain-containing protein [Oscillospiraceae bacterium]|nr:YARHG domain-containing protein [Oscillospiraceae bacterium]